MNRIESLNVYKGWMPFGIKREWGTMPEVSRPTIKQIRPIRPIANAVESRNSLLLLFMILSLMIGLADLITLIIILL